jgi:hypothetical protein
LNGGAIDLTQLEHADCAAPGADARNRPHGRQL